MAFDKEDDASGHGEGILVRLRLERHHARARIYACNRSADSATAQVQDGRSAVRRGGVKRGI